MENIILKQNREIEISEIEKIISFSPKSFLLNLGYATMLIDGEDLEMKSISENQTKIIVVGTIKKIEFDPKGLSVKKRDESFMKKLFK